MNLFYETLFFNAYLRLEVTLHWIILLRIDISKVVDLIVAARNKFYERFKKVVLRSFDGEAISLSVSTN